ncbi:MAG: hypothetical protein HYT87_08945 [Nitrospirae bacterium]|nr:hypothetical protein [Nitrospirota bacterium]
MVIFQKMKSRREAALLMNPSVRRQIERIARESGAPIHTLIERAVKKFVREFDDSKRERAFRRLASAKARSMGIKTLDDVDKLVHSLRS